MCRELSASLRLQLFHVPYKCRTVTGVSNAKTRRMEQRVDAETDELITKAAALTHESVSSFVVRSARIEASRVMARGDLTMMPASQFDDMLAALDAQPRSIPALARAANGRRFKRA